MSTIVDIVLLVVAGLMVFGSAALVVNGLRARAGTPSRSYGVQRQENRRAMLISFARAAVLFLIALVIFVIYGLLPSDEPTQVEVTPPVKPSPSSTTTSQPEREPSPTPLPSLVVLVSTPEMSKTQQVEQAQEPIPSPIVPERTAVPRADIVTVNSINGLWLRSEPDAESDQLELIPNETALVQLLGRELEWQQVRTPSGREGWVFIEYIIYQQQE